MVRRELFGNQDPTGKTVKIDGKVNTDPHSPGVFRTIGPLSNMPEFAQAFECKEGDAMVLSADKKAVIW